MTTPNAFSRNRASISMMHLFAILLAANTLPVSKAMLVPPPSLIHTAVGAIAGSTGAIAAYPIDFVKSQLQTEEGRRKYKGGFDAAKEIIQTSPHGPFALYKGLMVNVIGIAPEKTIKLSTNSIIRGALMGHFGYLPLAGEVAAGGFAGFTQVVVTNPLEVIKLKLQTSQMSFKDVMSQLQGVSDLYQGAGACIARDVMFSAVLFPLYAHLKVSLVAVLMGVAPGESATFWANLLAGSFAAAPAALLSTPADVVKTRLQQARNNDEDENNLESALLGTIQGDSNQQLPVQLQVVSSSGEIVALPNGDNRADENSFVGVMCSIARTEGPEVLFSGAFERVVRSVPQFGVTLAMFDLLNTLAINHGWLLDVPAS